MKGADIFPRHVIVLAVDRFPDWSIAAFAANGLPAPNAKPLITCFVFEEKSNTNSGLQVYLIVGFWKQFNTFLNNK